MIWNCGVQGAPRRWADTPDGGLDTRAAERSLVGLKRVVNAILRGLGGLLHGWVTFVVPNTRGWARLSDRI